MDNQLAQAVIQKQAQQIASLQLGKTIAEARLDAALAELESVRASAQDTAEAAAETATDGEEAPA